MNSGKDSFVYRHTVVSLPKIFSSLKEYIKGFRISFFNNRMVTAPMALEAFKVGSNLGK